MNTNSYYVSPAHKRRPNPLPQLMQPMGPAPSREERAIAFAAALAVLG